MLLLTALDIDMGDYYEILGIERTATLTEIRRAFLRKSKLHHPDRGGDPEMFRKVVEAYEFLKDKRKRFVYDTLGFNQEELLRGTNMLTDFLLAALQQGHTFEKQAKKFINQVVGQNIAKMGQTVAEMKAMIQQTETLAKEIDPNNYIMELALQNLTDKANDLRKDILGAEDMTKLLKLVQSLVVHIDLKTKDFPPAPDPYGDYFTVHALMSQMSGSASSSGKFFVSLAHNC